MKKIQHDGIVQYILHWRMLTVMMVCGAGLKEARKTGDMSVLLSEERRPKSKGTF